MAAEAANVSHEVESDLALLEQRLRRLEYLLTGSSNVHGFPHGLDVPQKSDNTVASKLANLQADLWRLRRLSDPAGSIVRGTEAIYAKFPELLSPSASLPSTKTSDQASVVLAHATLYPEAASRLASLQSLQIPSAEQSQKISVLAPHIAQAQHTQDELEQEVQDLQQRSAKCLEWWVRNGVVGMGDLWEEWEERLKDVERDIARSERRRREEEGYV